MSEGSTADPTTDQAVTTDQTAGPSRPNRPLHSFFANPTSATPSITDDAQDPTDSAAGPSRPAQRVASTTRKRRRKEDDAGHDQGRIAASADGWSIARQQNGSQAGGNGGKLAESAAGPGDGVEGSTGNGLDDSQAAKSVRSGAINAKAKGKRRSLDGEEAEMRDMAKRTKGAGRGSTGSTTRATSKQRKKKKDSSYIGGDSPDPTPPDPSPGSQVSPLKSTQTSSTSKSPRKSPRKRKPRAGDPIVTQQPANDAIIISSDPPDPNTTDILDPSQPLSCLLVRLKPGAIAKTKHQGLARTLSNLSANTTSSKGLAIDPINVDDHLHASGSQGKKSGPKKIVFASEQGKTAHSFFTRPLDQPASTSSSQVVNGSQEAAADSEAEADEADERGQMTLEAGPSGEITVPAINGLNGHGDKRSKGKVLGFFSGAAGAAMDQLKDGWGRGVKSGDEWLAPWPGADFPSHPTCSSTSVNAQGESTTTERHRQKNKVRTKYDIQQDLKQQDHFWIKLSPESASPTPITAPSDNRSPAYGMLSMITDHPALRSAASRHSSAHREAWTDLYAPQTASQVLGNETESTYLRDWLQALSIGTSDPSASTTSSSRRTVFREVNRSKAIDGWIVDDLALYGDTDEDEPDGEYEEFYEPPLRLGERPLSYPPLEDRLAGCMLLSGSTGTGKSAAVYAVAKELGWEVFEVNAGMGKRSGAGLMGWIGDVGKNHLVSKGRSEVHPITETKMNGVGGIGSFFANGTGSIVKEKTASQGSTHDPIEVDVSPHTAKQPVNGDRFKSNGKASNSAAPVQNGHRRGQSGDYRQSLILIEEADILFNEENTFWPTIISLISESRRPVVITCNGKSCSPLAHSIILLGFSSYVLQRFVKSRSISYLSKRSYTSNHLHHTSPSRTSRRSPRRKAYMTRITVSSCIVNAIERAGRYWTERVLQMDMNRFHISIFEGH